MDTTTDHVIAEARRLIQTHGWTQGTRRSKSGAMCLTEALFVAAHNDGSMYSAAIGVLRVRLRVTGALGTWKDQWFDFGAPAVMAWNDTRGRTLDEVLTLLRTEHHWDQLARGIDCGLTVVVRHHGDTVAERLNGPCPKRKEVHP